MPVVGFEDCSGLNSLVKHDENGVLVASRGHREINLTAALVSLIRDEERLSRLREDAPKSIEKYNPEIVYNKWEEVLTGR